MRHIRSRSTTRKQESKKESQIQFSLGSASTWISATTLTLSVLSVLLFTAGKAYRNAYLSEFGISEWNLPWSVQDLIYLGAVNQLSILLLAPLIFMLACISYVFCIWVVDLLSQGLRKYVESKFPAIFQSKRTRNVVNNQKQDLSLDIFKVLAIPLVAALAAILVAIPSVLYAASAERAGKKQGEMEKLAILENNPGSKARENLSWALIRRRIQDQEITEVGYLISCTEKACAMFQRVQNGSNITGKAKIVPLEGVTEFSGKDVK
jgi:hypothetical protein